MITENQRFGLRNWQLNFIPDIAGQRYERIRKNLSDKSISNAVVRISQSERFDFGEYSHICLKGTDTIVGYIGNESLELFCPKESEPILYRTPYKHLRRIFRAC